MFVVENSAKNTSISKLFKRISYPSRDGIATLTLREIGAEDEAVGLNA